MTASQAYQPGDPLDSASGNGAMVSAHHADSVMRAIEAGHKHGTMYTGGRRREIGSSNTFIEPTLIGGLTLDHILHRDEIFGPVAVVHKFASEDEAVKAANATQYGLAASIWTSNLAREHRFSSSLVAGTVSVNTVDALSLTTPFGGFKQSGFGEISPDTPSTTTWASFMSLPAAIGSEDGTSASVFAADHPVHDCVPA